MSLATPGHLHLIPDRNASTIIFHRTKFPAPSGASQPSVILACPRPTLLRRYMALSTRPDCPQSKHLPTLPSWLRSKQPSKIARTRVVQGSISRSATGGLCRYDLLRATNDGYFGPAFRREGLQGLQYACCGMQCMHVQTVIESSIFYEQPFYVTRAFASERQ